MEFKIDRELLKGGIVLLIIGLTIVAVIIIVFSAEETILIQNLIRLIVEGIEALPALLGETKLRRSFFYTLIGFAFATLFLSGLLMISSIERKRE